MMTQAHDLCGCSEHRGTDTQSPFWLELNGEWVHLQGVAPTYPITRERPRSEFISLGGYRYAQQARKASKEWELTYEYASPEALAALEIAAQFGGVVRLWDEAAAAANAVCPEVVQGASSQPVILAGDMPLRAFPRFHNVTLPVKPGETYRLSMWTNGTSLGNYRVGSGGSAQTMASPPGTGARRYLSPPISVPAGVEEILISLSQLPIAARTSGLMLTLGEGEPCRFISGQCALNTVTVEDPQHNRSMIPRSGAKGYGDWTVTLKEVCP